MRDDPQLLNASNLAFVEELYGRFQADPSSVPDEWRRYFQGWPVAGTVVDGPSFEARGLFHAAPAVGGSSKQAQVDDFVRRWRERGHFVARIDPFGNARPERRDLELAAAGLSTADLASSFTFHGRTETLATIVERLKTAWTGSIGVQFMHIEDDAKRAWLVERFESPKARPEPKLEERVAILERLTSALVFETTIQKKFLGSKSFSLEGNESLIPLLFAMIEHCGAHGVEDVVLGMAHRGRLNVLTHIAGKRPRDVFREFADLDAATYKGKGDVKYHLGWSTQHATPSGSAVRVSLCSNPSHLEFVNTVALGRARARSTRRGDVRSERGLAVLLHGDAAFAGQGIVQETLNLSKLAGYQTGGTLHVVVNNQVGFTTDPDEARSTPYATDVALMLQVPILHVNGEDPEAVCEAVRIALDYRQQFASEVVIDLVGYRRHGHNEADEPAFTQPLLYKQVRETKPTRERYLDRLVLMELVAREQGEAIFEAVRARYDAEYEALRASDYAKPAEPKLDAWKGFTGGADAATPELDTGIARDRLTELLVATTKLPEGFKPHPKIERFLETRLEMALGKRALDWSAGEALALGSLAVEGTRVRLTGQDCERGTFTHRHAVLHDPETGKEHATLAHLDAKQAPVEIVNSPLSEAGVMGFEYGFSLDFPEALVLWEAQFGDFVNAAQVIWDQFLSSAEDKWKHNSGLGLLLPHAFEGQGPEHSSARLERFLASCANDNVQVCYPTTPAQMFHLLRRQAKRVLRKPLVVMTPKSLLRHPRATSKLDELARGRFQRVIADTHATPKSGKVGRVVLCTGKVYFDLEEEREKRKLDVPILRVEQLYPLSKEELLAALAKYADGTEIVWAQEEPENMGAWRFVDAGFGAALRARFALRAVTRPEAASPATGSLTAHKAEQAELVERALVGG
ncbi:MAG: 2-oxoglutarate dehydrogenase E1 component [Planctomycetes bacterium]|nr:2-oxoglutarate dehydrogenase E1 component [Planctomycetota bacterium]